MHQTLTLVPFIVGLLVAPALADTGYKQLFSKSKGIAVEDQIAIYRQLRFTLAPDGKQFVNGGCDPAAYEVETPDLNDGACLR